MNNINRHNYETFFLLYVDNELSAADRQTVEAFVQQNPDLKGELQALQQTTIRPEKNISFSNKEALLKPVSTELDITATNCETFFVLYADDELTNEQKAAVEGYVYHHPETESTFELLQQVKLEPDNSIVFPNKESLYRTEDDDKVVPFRWWRLAAAALLLLTLGTWWLINNRSNNSGRIETARNTFKTNQSSAPVHPVNPSNTINNSASNINPTAPDNVSENNNTLAKSSSVKPANNNDQKNKEQVLVTVNQQKNEQTPTEDQSLTTRRDPQARVIDLAESNTVPSINIKNSIISGEKKLNIDQPDPALLASNTAQNANYASDNEDNSIEILNTSIDKKTALGGFLTKASHFISKKTDIGNKDKDGNRRGLVIGRFEIAVK